MRVCGSLLTPDKIESVATIKLHSGWVVGHTSLVEYTLASAAALAVNISKEDPRLLQSFLVLTHVVEPDRYVVVDRVQRGDDDGEEDLGAEFEEFEVSPLLDDDVPPLLQLEDDPHGGEHDQQAEGDDRNGDAVP